MYQENDIRGSDESLLIKWNNYNYFFLVDMTNSKIAPTLLKADPSIAKEVKHERCLVN